MTSHNGGGERCLAVVTGATGLTGRHCVSHILSSRPSWRVVTLSRRPLELGSGAEGKGAADRVSQAHADLLDGGAVRAALEGAAGAVEEPRCVIFHCAYMDSGEGAARDCQLNGAMLENVVEAVEGAGWPLRHVFTMEGSKWYGQQFLVPLDTPYVEKHGADRHPGPNFYYNLEDELRGRVAGGAGWTWSALRPGPVMGYSTGSVMSLLPTLGAYGSLCAAAGLPLHFPGTQEAFEEPVEVCDAEVLAAAMLHTTEDPRAANQAFNVSNGDVFRWRQVWPALAEFFGCRPGGALRPGTLGEAMAAHAGLWEGLVKLRGLRGVPLDKLATWTFMDFVFRMPRGGWFSNVTKLRRAGFEGRRWTPATASWRSCSSCATPR